MLDNYLENIFKTAKAGDAREESYYFALKQLIEEVNEKVNVTTLPKKTEAGNPDFRVWDGKAKVIGYIEAKSLTTENLDAIENSEQLKRYRETFPNLILTNFFEFRLYRNGELINHVSIGRPFVIHQLHTVPPVENQEKFLQFIKQFFAFSIPKTTTARTLAIELAKRTRFLRDNVVAEELKEEKVEGTQTLEGFYKAFKESLITQLTLTDFSNLFAQTITYGLFAARSRSDNGFNRESAYKYIPHTIGILRDVFRFISSTDLPKSMEWIVDDIAEVLANADVKKIINNFYKEGKGHDPIVHFYETFLAQYDPKEREKRGVYYTPEPVVEFIVKSIHTLLKEKFDKQDGFATQSVTVLDPAAGTITFPAEAIRLAINEYKNKYGDGGIKNLIKDHVLKNFYAFELMMAPYAVGHLKASLLLDEYGYKLQDEDRFRLYLTNSLEFGELKHIDLPLFSSLSDESHEAGKIKKNTPIMVIFGNPPYSVSSSNIIKKDSDLYELYESYKETVRKTERNIQPLSDDYIKFIALAHWKIKQVDKGIIGMITNNSYLDGLIHRDMRRRLLEDFDDIYVLDLKGDLKRKGKDEKDENVFDIRQGVSIILLVKTGFKIKRIQYHALKGLREEKYNFLKSNDLKSVNWKLLTPKEPTYFFVTKNIEGQDKYNEFTSLKDIFSKYNAGIATGKDDVLVDFDKKSLIRKLSANDKATFELVMQSYKVQDTLTNIWFKELNGKDIENQITAYSYRPFDVRFTIYNSKIIQRAREVIMNNLLSKNIALCVTNTSQQESYNEVFVSEAITDKHVTGHQTYVFPLYLKHEKSQQSLIDENSNIKLEFQAMLNNKYNPQPVTTPLNKQMSFNITPEETFRYIYAVLYSNIYRQKYQEFLKIDFPRIPFTSDYQLFKKLANLGEQIVNLHLLKSPLLNEPIVKFHGPDGNKVDKREYEEKSIYINDSQYFSEIDPETWTYQIGSYQVLDKWLKDRKGRTLSSEEIKHFCKVATAISKTIDLQKEIDDLYEKVEKSLEVELDIKAGVNPA